MKACDLIYALPQAHLNGQPLLHHLLTNIGRAPIPLFTNGTDFKNKGGRENAILQGAQDSNLGFGFNGFGEGEQQGMHRLWRTEALKSIVRTLADASRCFQSNSDGKGAQRRWLVRRKPVLLDLLHLCTVDGNLVGGQKQEVLVEKFAAHL